MGTWNVTPSQGVTFSPSASDDNPTISFPANESSSEKTYTVKYDDGNGNCGSMKVRQKPGSGGGGGGDLTGHCSVSIQNNTSNDFTITNKVVIYVTNRETQQPCYNGVFLYLNGREEDSSTYFLQRNAGLEFTGVFVKSNSSDPVINQDICLLCGERKVKLYQTNGEDIEWTGINHPHIIGTNVKLTDGGSYTIRIDSSCT